MDTATAYAKYAQLQALLIELHGAPSAIKEEIATYLEDEATTFGEESEEND